MATPIHFPTYTQADKEFILSYCSAVQETLVPNELYKTRAYQAFKQIESLKIVACAVAAVATTLIYRHLLVAIEDKSDFGSSILKAIILILPSYAFLICTPLSLYATKVLSLTQHILKASKELSNTQGERVDLNSNSYKSIYSKLLTIASLQEKFDADLVIKTKTHIVHVGFLFASATLHYQRRVSNIGGFHRQSSLVLEGIGLGGFIFSSIRGLFGSTDPRNYSQLGEIITINEIRAYIDQNPEWSALRTST